jgi:hypothetical protein
MAFKNAEESRRKRADKEAEKKKLQNDADLERKRRFEERQSLINQGITPEPASSSGPKGKISKNSWAEQLKKKEQDRKEAKDKKDAEAKKDAEKKQPEKPAAKEEPVKPQEPESDDGEPSQISTITEGGVKVESSQSSFQSFKDKTEKQQAVAESSILLLEQQVKNLEELISLQQVKGADGTPAVMSSLPDGNYEYEVLRWYGAPDNEWKPDWVRAH